MSKSRYEYSDACSKLAEESVYPSFMGAGCTVQRFMNADNYATRDNVMALLDKDYGIDAMITAESGRLYSIAERFRGAKYEPYQEITVRLGGKHSTGKREFDKCIARYLLYAYVDVDAKQYKTGMMPSKITSWVLVEMQPFLDLFNAGKISHEIKTARDGSWAFASVKISEIYKAGLIRVMS